MKSINVTVLVCSVFALIGSLLPMATKGSLYVDISHIGGATYLLMLIPLYLIVASILALNGRILSLKSWYLPATLLGLILSLLACYAGLRQVESFANFSRGLVDTNGEASLGLGAIALILVYLVSTFAPLLNSAKSHRQAEA